MEDLRRKKNLTNALGLVRKVDKLEVGILSVQKGEWEVGSQPIDNRIIPHLPAERIKRSMKSEAYMPEKMAFRCIKININKIRRPDGQ